MKRALAALLLACSSFMGMATTYYVSHNGNDSNSGTSQSSPWRSIARVTQIIYSLEPGDHILFERGGVYPGRLDIPKSGTSSNPIVVGAYGSGEKPIISGGVPVTNWTQHSGNIWRASLSTAPKYVLVNNVVMQLARFPNSGWLRNDQGSTTQINCSDLNQSGGYWNNARLVVRTSNYSYETAKITSSNSGSINFEPITTNLSNKDWGFFIEGKLHQLDMAGEWYYDEGSQQLYLWAPNNANPNNLGVLASIYDMGIVPGWQRAHMRIEDLIIQGQTKEGISTSVSNNVVVTNCEIRYCYQGISSSGHSNQYINNHIHNTFGAGMNVYDENTLVEDNIFNDIAVRPGMGEQTWGYWGINASNTGTVIRNNRLTNIGYIGIGVGKNVLVEKNVVINATSILNDGAGISFDHADGAIIRDNVVLDCVGDLESVATNHSIYYYIAFGIYFGNTLIKNTTVERNTVANCTSAGIHVDHTMQSSGNQIKDNVMFNNGVQLSLSDYSNSHGTGATPPYYVANYNTIYSGNVMYSLREDQFCMRHYQVYSANHVDFGTFTNNRYFNPHNELSIMIKNLMGGGEKRYTLEQWQTTFNEDAGSARSPLRLTHHTTLTELSDNLIVNGDFSQSISNWVVHPGNGQVSIDHEYLDDGALKVFLPNADVYPSMNVRSPHQFSMQNGQWYRMRLSIQSDQHGVMDAGIKGISQMGGINTIGEKEIPFSPERRDLEFYFQSQLSDQALLQLVNRIAFPKYWIDNIELHRVTVQEVDPTPDHLLFYNEFTMSQSYSIPEGCWVDVDGNTVDGDITLQPFRSKVIYRVQGEGCGVQVTHSVGAKVMMGGALLGNGTMRTDLKDQGAIPTTEPYSALGFSPANPGQQIASSLMQATGAQKIVDWVLLELREPGSFNVVEQMAALVRANGEVVAPDGSSQIEFSVATQGRHLAVHHRNHLSIMTASAISTNGQMIDLTTSGTPTYGSGARMTQGSIRAMWPGDVNGDGMVSYTNAGNDRDEVLVAIGSVVPSNTSDGYLLEDVNMDGVVKYTGTANDRDVILTSVGGSVPTAVRIQQMPQ